MKLSTSLSFFAILAISIWVFNAVGTTNQYSGTLLLYNETYCVSNCTDVPLASAANGPYLWEWFTNPINIFTSPIWVFVILTLVVGFVGAISVGVLKISTTDAITFSAFPLLVLTFGNICISTVFTFIVKELNSYIGHATTGSTLMPVVLALAFVSIPAFQFFLGVTQMWRTGFTNS